jgi:integrase
MSLRKTAEGRWEVRWWEGGRGSVRRQRTFDRKRDADAFDREIRRRKQLDGIVQLERGRITLAELMEDYWALHAVPNLAPSTRTLYAHVWDRHLRPRIGGQQVRAITPKVVARLRADLEREGVGQATVRKALAVLQSTLTFAVMEEHVQFNAAAVVRKPPDERCREPHVFLPAEVERLREQVQPLAATLLSVLAYSGPRPEEALRLTWADVGSEAIHYDGRKTRRPRWTPLLAQLATDLRAWRLASGRPRAGGPVFPAHDGGHWQPDDWRNWRHRTWQRVAPRGTRPRDLRGSYVTLRVYEGMPLTEIARHVGTSVAMLDRHYAGVIANWDGERVPADEQIRDARSAVRPLEPAREMVAEDAQA